MAFDPSIFDQANRPSVALRDPNEIMGGALDVQNKLQSIRANIAQQAVGEAAQQATGPDGAFSPNKFNSIIAKDPRAALAAQSAQVNLESLATSQQARALKTNDFLNATLPGLLQLPDDQLHDAAAGAMDRAVTLGLVPQTQASQSLAKLSTDPAALRRQLNAMQLAAMPPGAQRDQLYGAATTRDDGQSIQSGVVLPASQGGGFVPSSATPVYPSRSSLASRVQVGTNPDGSAVYGPAANVTPPGLAGPAGSPSPLGTGRLPAALRNPAGSAGPPGSGAALPAGPTSAAAAPAGTPPPAAAPSVPNNGEVTTGLGPAQTAARTATGNASAAAFQSIAEEGVAAKTQDATLANMLADTSRFATGPGQDRIKAFQAGLQRFAPSIASAFGVKPEQIAANESFDKLAAQIANAQGAGSDARLAVNQAGNPSSHLTPAGVDMILRQLRGNADYKTARANLAAAYPDKADREGFEAKVGGNLDPRVFQYARMTPEQRGTYLRSLPDKAQFKKAYGWAETNQLLGGSDAGR